MLFKIQRNLFGGFAKPKTYYNHVASSPFEKVIEAFISSTKKYQRAMLQGGNRTVEKLKKKGNEEILREYINHTRVLKQEQRRKLRHGSQRKKQQK